MEKRSLMKKHPSSWKKRGMRKRFDSGFAMRGRLKSKAKQKTSPLSHRKIVTGVRSLLHMAASSCSILKRPRKSEAQVHLWYLRLQSRRGTELLKCLSCLFRSKDHAEELNYNKWPWFRWRRCHTTLMQLPRRMTRSSVWRWWSRSRFLAISTIKYSKNQWKVYLAKLFKLMVKMGLKFTWSKRILSHLEHIIYSKGPMETIHIQGTSK